MFELLNGSMFQGGHELHERAKVLLVNALLSKLYQELQHLHSVGKVALVSYTPHEEKGHLQCNTQNLMSVSTRVYILLYTLGIYSSRFHATIHS